MVPPEANPSEALLPCGHAYAERFVLTARTEATGQMLIFNE
jgi:hypothetical protein